MSVILNRGPRVFRTGLAVLSLLFLTGCSAEAENLQSATSATEMKASGVLDTSTGTYQFTPSSCGVHYEDGVLDIEIGGPGTAPDGEIFYFELSSIANQIIIELGVDGPFKTSDRQLRSGQHTSETFTIDVSDKLISVSGLVLVDEQGDRVDAPLVNLSHKTGYSITETAFEDSFTISGDFSENKGRSWTFRWMRVETDDRHFLQPRKLVHIKQIHAPTLEG